VLVSPTAFAERELGQVQPPLRLAIHQCLVVRRDARPFEFRHIPDEQVLRELTALGRI
jgi:hypothetical protein